LTQLSIEYRDSNFRLRRKDVNPDDKSIMLRNKGIVEIDLSPCSQLSKLTELHLSFNSLIKIDLTPLSNCSLLKTLRLDGNMLLSIDLTPLASCKILKTLDLSQNPLQTIYIPDDESSYTLKGLVRKYKVSGSFRTGPPPKKSDTRSPIGKKALGVLKSFGSISMEDLTKYTGLTVEENRELVFELVGEGLVRGKFDPSSDTFVSADAADAGKSLRSEGLILAKCAYCGTPLPKGLTPGEELRCPSCGIINIG